MMTLGATVVRHMLAEQSSKTLGGCKNVEPPDGDDVIDGIFRSRRLAARTGCVWLPGDRHDLTVS